MSVNWMCWNTAIDVSSVDRFIGYIYMYTKVVWLLP